MITKRIIPCLDVKNGRVVKGVNFEGLHDVSSPIELAEYYTKSGADELVFYDITASADEPLLTSIERAGIVAPSRCRSGECSWCRSKLVSGKVFVPEKTDGRRRADIEFGYIHPCASFPMSDIVLDVPNSTLK